MKKLLIIACSEKKSKDSGMVHAVERYDGPAFRVLRRFIREQPGDVPTIYILSGKFGLIRGHSKIPAYNSKMTHQRAIELRPLVTKSIARVIEHTEWSDIGISAGKAYLEAMPGIEELCRQGTAVEYLSGSLGKRLSALFRWLRQEVPAHKSNSRG